MTYLSGSLVLEGEEDVNDPTCAASEAGEAKARQNCRTKRSSARLRS